MPVPSPQASCNARSAGRAGDGEAGSEKEGRTRVADAPFPPRAGAIKSAKSRAQAFPETDRSRSVVLTIGSNVSLLTQQLPNPAWRR